MGYSCITRRAGESFDLITARHGSMRLKMGKAGQLMGADGKAVYATTLGPHTMEFEVGECISGQYRIACLLPPEVTLLRDNAKRRTA
ncbi:hypothetical protein D3C78_298030 [compost metagenome]